MDRLSLGPFDLIRPIGKGSMGVVWEGIHRSQALPVAIKVLTAVGAQDETFRQSFANEVRAVARLHHPSIIRLLDYGITDGDLCEASEGQIASGSQYYAMELASGGTLPKPHSPLPWLQMRYLLLELLDALAHAHARDVIHRDIKPGNILLMHDGMQSRVMLTDFGIAKAVGTKELPDGMVAGTPRYMAPEQIMNQTRDQGPWTDLYSIGCLAYLFATGHRIFSHATGTEVLRCQIHERPEPVTSRHLPEGFQGWLDKMLAQKVSARFEYAAEAAWELVCLPDPVEEQPESGLHLKGSERAVLDSCECHAANEQGLNSSIYHTLYQPDQISMVTGQMSGVSESAEDDNLSLADNLLADMGDTMRMDSEDIARVISQQTQAAKEREEREGHELSTLAEMYRQRLNAEPIIYEDKAVVPAPQTWQREVFQDGFGQVLGAGLGLWGLRSIPMVGREYERDVIYEQLLKTREDRQVRCILLDGPRGTGKSRIIEWMSQRAHELSIAHILKALHYENHLKAPGVARAMMYYLSCQNLTRHQALERIQWFLNEHVLEHDYDDALPLLELMELQDDPENPVPGIHFASAEEQYAVICRFMRRICHDRAAVLWLDDIHYSEYSLGFVEYMLKSEQASGIPILLLATSRSEDMTEGSDQDAAYKRVVLSEHVTKLDVAPLSSQSHLKLVHQLIGLDDELCSQVAQRTSGMPLFAIQLVGDWVERGLLVPSDTGFKVRDNASVELPDSLHELWLSRIRLIFRDSKRMTAIIEQLELAACLGGQFDADEWRIACEMAELGSNQQTLECMLEHQLFELRFPNIAFVHDLLRESLVRYAKENGRYRHHHQHCADMLQAYFSDALRFYHERRAEHLFAARAYETCIEPLLLAANLRRQLSEFNAAHKLFERRSFALDACKADENSPIRALGWIAQAATWIQQGVLESADSLLERSLELGFRTHSPVIQALAYKEKGLLLHLRNCIGEAQDAFMASLSFFNQISERRRAAYENDRAETLWRIGRICDVKHELDLARVYLSQAIEIQTQTGDLFGLARSYKSLGNTLQHGNYFEEARQNIEYALNIFQQQGYRIYVANCLNDIGEIYRLGYHQPDQAEVYYRNALDIYRDVNPIDGCTSAINLVLILLSKERYTEAKGLVLSQIEMIEKSGQTFDLNWLYAALLPCCAATFDWPTFDDIVLRLGKTLEDSMVVDADILYCTEHAWHLCERYATFEQGRLCHEIAMQQAIRLNDKAAIARLQR
ncbi:MAG: protein kinase [Proteobacteria bacterium]|nr:protein kinase [Pseudomonadota bacterium]